MTRPTPALARVFDVLRAGGAASAVDARGEKSTYDDLSARVAGFSSALTSMRHGGRPRVAILSAKCVDAYAATLACVRSGATFCPLNTEAPAARNARILHDFAPDCVFLDPGAELHRIAALDGLPTLRADEGTTLAGARVVRPTDVAYVIYTSGTTGHPKGVQISYSNLDWFLGSVMERLDIPAKPRWSNHPNLAFDLSILDLFGTIYAAGTLVPITSSMSRAFPAQIIAEQDVDVWHSVPSIVESLRQARAGEDGMLVNLKRVVLCGEPCRRSWVEYLLDHCAPDVRVYNAYGPTETTVFCTTEEMRRGYAFVPDEATVPLGTPLEGADVDLVEAEDGGAELVISGPGVGPGYLRTREGERDGYRAEGERRRYFTGDLVEQRHGKVFYRQRADAQVKLRGNRFELSEIESVLEQFGVTGAHAVAVGDRVVVLIDDRCDRTDDELLATLKEHVPAYAVPRLIIRLEAWPRNVNDRIDRAKLRELAQHRLENG